MCQQHTRKDVVMSERIGVYGAGTIGSCEITLITGNSFPVTVIGFDDADLARCRGKLEQNWDDLIKLGLATAENKEAAMKLVTLTADPSALRDCTFVFEEVLEDIKIKSSVFKIIEANTGDDTIIASSTSSIDAEDLAASVTRPERLIIAHPFQPVHLQPLVELVCSQKTSEDTVSRAKAVLADLQRVVVCMKKSVPGFLVNRFAQTLFRESLYLIEQGVTTAEDVDIAVKYAVGMRYAEIGLLEYFDAVGFELESAIAKNVYPDLCDTKELQETVLEGLRTGKTGKMAGQGLFDWSERSDEDYRRRLNAPYLDGVKKWHLPKGE